MKNSYISLMSIVLVTLVTAFTTTAQVDNKPNIVIVMADDLGYVDLSLYGNQQINTPHINELANEGIRFTNFHSNGPVCSPTRAALLTGKYQQHTGVEGIITAKKHREHGWGLKEITIAEEFKNHGYHCGMYGKWHLRYTQAFNPIHQGFDEYTGFVSGNIDYHSHIDQEGFKDWWKGKVFYNEAGYDTGLITKYGVDFIVKNNSKETDKPFWLYLPMQLRITRIKGKKATVLGRLVSVECTTQKKIASPLSIKKWLR
jgi:arylsulfatase A-like enzyme